LSFPGLRDSSWAVILDFFRSGFFRSRHPGIFPAGFLQSPRSWILAALDCAFLAIQGSDPLRRRATPPGAPPGASAGPRDRPAW
jgi:hypothetical protein